MVVVFDAVEEARSREGHPKTVVRTGSERVVARSGNHDCPGGRQHVVAEPFTDGHAGKGIFGAVEMTAAARIHEVQYDSVSLVMERSSEGVLTTASAWARLATLPVFAL